MRMFNNIKNISFPHEIQNLTETLAWEAFAGIRKTSQTTSRRIDLEESFLEEMSEISDGLHVETNF